MATDVVTVPSGGNVTCSITNTAIAPRLTLVKRVVNDNGGTAEATDWTLSAAGPSPISGVTGSDPVTGATVAVGDYTLDESGPTGYEASDWVCVDDTGAPFPVSGASLTLAEGDDVECTIVNDNEPATLTLVKVVDNGTTGATAAGGEWTLTADGPTTITGAGNSPAVTDQTVNAGDYTLSEADGPDGYTASDWTCTGGTLTGATVTVPNGGDVECTITNTAIAPTLTLIKTVENGDTGATTEATEWTLSGVNGGSTITGSTGTPPVTGSPAIVGTYDLTETGPPGYDASDWTCTGGTATTADSVTLALADAATCRITNTAQQPHLTLVKEVENDNGGTAVATDWTLAAAGPTAGISGPSGDPAVTGVPVEIGGYDLSESGGPAAGGYEASDWTCEGGTLTGATVVVALGDDVTCTIVNSDIPGTWVLTKASDPASGATVEPGDTITYTLTATNNSPGIVAGATVTDDLSDVLDDATIGTIGAGGTLTGTTLTWAVPTLQPGDVATLSYTVTVNEGAYGVSIGNVATPSEGGECEEPDDCTTVHPTPHWVVNKSSDPASGATVNPGEVITYTLTATNDSDGVVTGATVTDDLSDVLDNATMGTINPGDQASLSGTTLTWTLPSPLNPGDVATLTYTVTVNDGAYYEHLNNVATPGPGGECVSPDELVSVDMAGSTEAAALTAAGITAAAVGPEWCQTQHPTPGWTLEKSSDPASGSQVQPGDRVTYTLTVTNDSDGVVSGAEVTDDLSDVLAYASLDSVPSGATLSGTTLTWDVPTIQPGRGAELTYTVTVNDDAWDVSFGNVAAPGAGGTCTECTTIHETPPEPSQPSLPNTGGSGLLPLGLGAGFLIAGVLLLAEARRRQARVPARIEHRR